MLSRDSQPPVPRRVEVARGAAGARKRMRLVRSFLKQRVVWGRGGRNRDRETWREGGGGRKALKPDSKRSQGCEEKSPSPPGTES